MVASVSVRPALLRWARERALMSPQDLAEKMRVPASKVLEWEETGSLSLPRLEKLANRTRTPLGYLFLEKPPDDSLPIADYRTLADVDEQKASPDLLETIHICQLEIVDAVLNFWVPVDIGERVRAIHVQIPYLRFSL